MPPRPCAASNPTARPWQVAASRRCPPLLADADAATAINTATIADQSCSAANQYDLFISGLQYGAPWLLNCNGNNDPSTTTAWPQRCLLPCVQYGVYDEPYYSTPVLPTYSSPKALCPCGAGLLEPWTLPHDAGNARANGTMSSLLAWWDANVHASHTTSRWTDAQWTSQAAWMGGSSLRDATWRMEASYCSWPFLECKSDCATSHALSALDLRNASLYIPQLDFSAMASGMSQEQRSDIWYM